VLASTSHRVVARLAELALPGQVHLGRTATEPIRRLPSGLAGIDALLDGGVPRGRVSELCGAASCGKTSLLFTMLAAVTQGGEVAAYVDLADALHPQSAAYAGVDLRRLLWVRPRSAIDGMRCTELLLHAGGFAAVACDLGAGLPRAWPGPLWLRLRRAAERSHAALIIVGPQRVAGTCAVLGLGVRPAGWRWGRGAWPLFEGGRTVVRVERNKLGIAEGKAGRYALCLPVRA
jgi:hypothetical protein